MQLLSLVWGCLSILGMIIAFLPCFGSLNWLNIPFAGVGLVISIVALTQVNEGEKNTNALVGLVLCVIAVVFGMVRLMLGGGVV